ncbi:MAG: CpsD/CapB family tyrosine-protein kinase, partial [Pseudomonadota bacterium]
RTGLQFSLAAKQSKVLMITSCAPGDGKSFISLNLGLVAAAAGGSVLLMDVDLRRGVLARSFGLDRRAPGISDLLAGNADFAQIVTKDPATGLEFIPSGRYPPNPSELLSSDAFAGLIDNLSNHYDLIILDAPPALAVTDPAIIGQTAGISLLVVTHMKTKLADIQSAQQIMS